MSDYDEIKNRAKRGVVWNIFGTYGNMLLAGVVTIFLARILGPDIYGVLFSVTVFLGFMPILVNFGFEQAIVADQKLLEEDTDAIFSLILLLSIGFSFLVLAFLPYLLKTFTEVDAVELVYFLAPIIVINGIGIVPKALLGKRLAFKELNKVLIFTTPVPGIVALVMAFLGYGIWALVVQQLLAAFFKTSLYLSYAKYKPRINVDFKRLGRFRKFCSNLFLDQSVFYFAANMDGALVAALFSSNTVGFYTKSMEFLRKPVSQINSVFLSVLFPTISHISSDVQKVRGAYTRLIEIMAFVIFPLISVIGLMSAELILLIFGEKWQGMLPYVNIFAWGVVVIPLTYIGTNTILALGRTGLLLRLNIIYRIVLISLLGIAAFMKVSSEVIAIIVTASFYLQFFLANYFVSRMLNIGQFQVVKFSFKTILTSLFTLGVMHYLLTFFMMLPLVVHVIVSVAGFGLTYLFLSSIWNKLPIGILVNNLPLKIKSKIPVRILNYYKYV